MRPLRNSVLPFARPSGQAQDFVRPGHVFPLRAAPGGVLKRSGHTEAAADLATLAGLKPAGVLSEIVNDDGTMARREHLEIFAKCHNIPFINIADLVRYRRCREKLVKLISKASIPTNCLTRNTS